MLSERLEKYLQYLDKQTKLHEEFFGKSHALHSAVANLKGYLEGFFTLAKFKPGDRVQLVDDVNPTEDSRPGWVAYAPTLVHGAKAEVAHVDFCSHLDPSIFEFRYDIRFDTQLWVSSMDGEVKESDERSLFSFWEHELEALQDSEVE